MDEFSFRLFNQIESLQIRASLANEQARQLFSRWLLVGHRYIQDVRGGSTVQEFKDFFEEILTWFQKQIHTIHYHFSCIRFNPRHIYQHFINIFPIDVSKKEFIYFSTGLIAGTVIGYSIALNWYTSHYSHYIKAIVCQCYIGIQGVLMIEDAEMPVIQKANELLIQVKAASINEVDIKICSGYAGAYRRLLNRGKYKRLPVILGRDCAGVVVEIGREVVNFDIGDKVFLAVPSWSTGTMAEYITVPETQVVKMPKNLSFEASATLPYSGCLAWDALVNSKIVEEDSAKGKRILVCGGSTSVGCILVQLVKFWSGYVVTICKLEAASIIKELGSDEIILFDESKMYKDLELQNNFDAIFFTGGTYTINENILKKYLLPNGSFVSITPKNLTSDSFGFISGTLFAGCIKIRLMLQYIFGASTYQWNDGSKLKTTYLQSLQELVENNQLQPIFKKVYASHYIDQALSNVTNCNAIGSTVIKF